MVDVTTVIRIVRSIEEVAGYSGDPSNAPEWYVNIRSVEWRRRPHWLSAHGFVSWPRSSDERCATHMK